MQLTRYVVSKILDTREHIWRSLCNSYRVCDGCPHFLRHLLELQLPLQLHELTQPLCGARFVGQYRPMLCPFTHASPFPIPVKSMATGSSPAGAVNLVCTWCITQGNELGKKVSNRQNKHFWPFKAHAASMRKPYIALFYDPMIILTLYQING